MDAKEMEENYESTSSGPTMQSQHHGSLSKPKAISSDEQSVVEAVRILVEKQASLCAEHRMVFSELQKVSDQLIHVQQSISEYVERLGKTQEDMQELNVVLQWIISSEESAKGVAKNVVEKYKMNRTENMNDVIEKCIFNSN